MSMRAAKDRNLPPAASESFIEAAGSVAPPKPPQRPNRPRDYVERREQAEEIRAQIVLPGTPFQLSRQWKKHGKQTKLTQEAIDEVCALVAASSCTVSVAAIACGYGSSYISWSKAAREHEELGYEPGFGEGQSPFLEWQYCLDQAKAINEASLGLIVNQAARGEKGCDWKAAFALLERRHSERWREKKDVTVAMKSPDDVARELSTQEIEKELKLAMGIEESKK